MPFNVNDLVTGRKWRRILGLLILLLVSGIGMLLAADYWVSRSASGRIFGSAQDVPRRPVAVVLGCVKMMKGGWVNPFFKARIAAAAALYREDKVSALIVSGDNHTKGYDEPTDMKEALIAEGVPEHRIFCDYAGFRTLDSMVRAKEVFGQSRFIIVSQHFHNERALYIARRKGLDAIALDAGDIPFRWAKGTYLREYLARAKAVLDVEVLGTRPRFLGEPVEITVVHSN